MEYFQTCHSYMYGIMKSDVVKQWRNKMEEKSQAVEKIASTQGGPSVRLLTRLLSFPEFIINIIIMMMMMRMRMVMRMVMRMMMRRIIITSIYM